MGGVALPTPVQNAFEAAHAADEIIDVRAPCEFEEDHIPGAINLPVLDNDERARVGTRYKGSAFDAKKQGAALVAANIAKHIENHFGDKPGGYQPMVYCWRGGSRSASMALVLAQIGWRVGLLDGGYKSYRHQVLELLDTLPASLTCRVVAGLTGVGKTALLAELASRGEQVLDLEGLADHRGSLLGAVDGTPQPPQKLFESRLASALVAFDPSRPVWVESESAKVGDRQVPKELWKVMQSAPRVQVTLPLSQRVDRILDDYPYWVQHPEELKDLLWRLKTRHGKEKIDNWCGLVDAGSWPQFVGQMLTDHYDVGYSQSMGRYVANIAGHFDLQNHGEAELERFVTTVTTEMTWELGAKDGKEANLV